MSAKQVMAVRKKYKLTQQELADALGVTSRTVQNWEKNGVTDKRTISALKNLNTF